MIGFGKTLLGMVAVVIAAATMTGCGGTAAVVTVVKTETTARVKPKTHLEAVYDRCYQVASVNGGNYPVPHGTPADVRADALACVLALADEAKGTPGRSRDYAQNHPG